MEIRESISAKYLCVTVYPDGKVVVTKPKRVSKEKVRRFVEERREWIEKHQASVLRRLKRDGVPYEMPQLRRGTKAYREAVEKARSLVKERLQHFSSIYGKELGKKYGRVSIRNQKTRWGSCSKEGNLNFNYKIVHLPPELADYIIAHELCHLKEMNHSERFWTLVEKAIPDRKKAQKEFRRYPLG